MPSTNQYIARLSQIDDRQSLHLISLSEFDHAQERQSKSFSDGHGQPTRTLVRG